MAKTDYEHEISYLYSLYFNDSIDAYLLVSMIISLTPGHTNCMVEPGMHQ